MTIKKCCMEGCDNNVDTEKDFLCIWLDEKEGDGYACESCMNKLGDE